jgi:hypothetical protein
VVVEKKLAREQNLSRHDLGREAFVSKVRAYLYLSVFRIRIPANDFGDPGSGSAILATRIWAL